MKAYYNDNDPFCCAVLRKQIARAKLPEGDVDERDVHEVRGAELAGYGHVHLFAGIGGFPLGLMWAGVPSHWRILTGGFPCQPHSVAGKRRASADERNLWPEFYRIACELRPDWILVENVPGLLSSEAGRFFGGILRDLAEIGYDAEWHCLRASDLGAPHIRERLFLVAYPTSGQDRGLFQPQLQADPVSGGVPLAYPASNRQFATGRPAEDDRDAGGRNQEMADATSRQCDGSISARARWPGFADRREDVADARRQRCEECDPAHVTGQPRHLARRTCAPGKVEYPTGSGQQSREHATGIYPEPDTSGEGAAQSGMGWRTDGISAGLDRYRWTAGPGQAQHEWEPPRTTIEHIPQRAAQLRAYGNAIVPQLAEIVGYWLLAIVALKERERAHV